MFRGLPWVLRCLVTISMVFAVAVVATMRTSSVGVAGRRSVQDRRAPFVDDVWVD